MERAPLTKLTGNALLSVSIIKKINQIRICNAARILGVITKSTKAKSICG